MIMWFMKIQKYLMGQSKHNKRMSPPLYRGIVLGIIIAFLHGAVCLWNYCDENILNL